MTPSEVLINNEQQPIAETSIRFRGVRGSIPSPAAGNLRYGGNTACVEVRAGEQLLVLDAGSGLRLLGDDLLGEANGEAIRASVLLSHSHWDHIQGLLFFSPIYSAQNRIRILGAHGRADLLQKALTNQMNSLHFPVGIEAMKAFDAVEELARGVNDLGNFRVRTTELNHPGGCTGFRIETAAGSLAYLPDHEPYSKRSGDYDAGLAQRGLAAFISGVDVLILDTQYTEEEYAGRVGWGHGCLPDSVKLALEAGVSRLVLFHHDPSHDDERIDRMTATAHEQAAGSDLAIAAASENEVITLRRPVTGLGLGADYEAPGTTVPNSARRVTAQIFTQVAAKQALGML